MPARAVVPDGSMDIPLALRLKLQGQEITEIETIAVRPGDYKVSGQNFASNTGAIIASGDTVEWEEPVPGSPALPPRLVFAEVERGIGVGFTMFMGNTDMHMFKMRGGQVYGVSAILGAASSSGWE
ncbi:hypothetical protein ACSRUE_21120 [Sorangium sp. KYC3313]|uniref:hypothetical protein n=1 Tax=Sorangium sp. KYC3313 TaxID=3449740 RepID=UPI003F8C1FEA